MLHLWNNESRSTESLKLRPLAELLIDTRSSARARACTKNASTQIDHYCLHARSTSIKANLQKKKGFNFISNHQRREKKARDAHQGEVRNRTLDLWVESQVL